ncbi:uncharacterized protein LOC118233343 isoform X2 [Anguilla anguilla]|uniref:uncharacterized protein LOC118233343 isoform X2 n=2 Tax=Anguilla anguilla TaxID=7936 RepID=UPI0015AB2418|nr:uncharacterized protein LOC118233343 isoform X2 [Anguilla anguilla]
MAFPERLTQLTFLYTTPFYSWMPTEARGQMVSLVKMEMTRVVVFSVVFFLASARLEVKEEPYTAFFGEDVHLPVPSLKTTEVLFKPSVGPEGSEDVLMRDGVLFGSRAKLNPQRSHLILEDVGEKDEGVYVIKHTDTPEDVKHIILMVRDCTIEHNLKYGETYLISLSKILGPITLEFRSSVLQLNQTSDGPVLLLNQTWTPSEEYKARLTASEKRVILHTVTGSDEGSYTILDSDEKVRKRTCLNVKEHQVFVQLPYAGTLKINLILDPSKVTVQYRQRSSGRARLILDRGELVVPGEPSLDKRLSVDGSMLILERVRFSDSGQFTVTDLQGFVISNTEVEVEAYKLPPLYVAIISLLSLLVFLLFVCLLSCLAKVHYRAKRARAIARIAQEAGKGDGETFRQVVHEAYTRFTEESTMKSQWDSNTDNTEADIKGLEVSKGGRYHTLLSDKNFLETSDSGVEFNISGFPLDSDTDVPPSYLSFLDSDKPNGTSAPDPVQSTKQAPDSQPGGGSGGTAQGPRVGSSPEVGLSPGAGHEMAAPPPEADPANEADKDSAPPSDAGAGQDGNGEKAAN